MAEFDKGIVYKDCEVIVKHTLYTDGAINAVLNGELVRCKDCRWHNDQNGATGWMPCREMQTPNDFYCASGERKDGDHHADS